MDIQDVLFDSSISDEIRKSFMQIVINEEITDPYIKVIKRTVTNDDVNGSQHAFNGGNDFTYEDVTYDDVIDTESIGYYEYFSQEYGKYTGHYYHGSSNKFAAIVINPPEYAISIMV